MKLSKRTGTTAAIRRQQAWEKVAARDYEQTCQAIAQGLADIDAGRTISFEEVRARWKAEKVERANLPKRTGIL